MTAQINCLSRLTLASGEFFDLLQLAHNRFAVRDSHGNIAMRSNKVGIAWEGMKYAARLHPIHGHSPAVECSKHYYDSVVQPS